MYGTNKDLHRIVGRGGLLILLGLALAGCLGKQLEAALLTLPVENKIESPKRDDVRLSALWVGHATLLVQMDDKFILTDPVFTTTVGQVSSRIVEPGIDVENLPPIDLVTISHMHFDHLSLGTLEMIEPLIKHLVVPTQGLVYLPGFDFPATQVDTWQTLDLGDGLRVTAVPVKHTGFRYGIDRAWMTQAYTGYVIEYHGLTVYFGGDTAYDAGRFRQTARAFPSIDLALIPVGPLAPRAMMARNHVNADEALQMFEDLGAQHMIPMHFGTFMHGLDAWEDPEIALRQAMHARGLVDGETVHILAIGEQRVFVEKISHAMFEAARSP